MFILKRKNNLKQQRIILFFPLNLSQLYNGYIHPEQYNMLLVNVFGVHFSHICLVNVTAKSQFLDLIEKHKIGQLLNSKPNQVFKKTVL